MHMDGRARYFEGAFHDLDGTVHTGTKTAGIGQQNVHERTCGAAAVFYSA